MLSAATNADDIPIFCQTKESAFRVSRLLLSSSPKRQYVSMYHANLTKKNKTFVYNNFKCGTMRIIAATVAFGMVCISTLIIAHVPFKGH